jgi:hypothetical protein
MPLPERKKNRHLKQNAPYLYWNENKQKKNQKQTLYIVFIVKAGNGKRKK